MTTPKPAQQRRPVQRSEDDPIDYDSLEYDPFDPDPLPDAMLQYPVLKGLLAVLSSRAHAKKSRAATLRQQQYRRLLRSKRPEHPGIPGLLLRRGD